MTNDQLEAANAIDNEIRLAQRELDRLQFAAPRDGQDNTDRRFEVRCDVVGEATYAYINRLLIEHTQTKLVAAHQRLSAI